MGRPARWSKELLQRLIDQHDTVWAVAQFLKEPYTRLRSAYRYYGVSSRKSRDAAAQRVSKPKIDAATFREAWERHGGNPDFVGRELGLNPNGVIARAKRNGLTRP